MLVHDLISSLWEFFLTLAVLNIFRYYTLPQFHLQQFSFMHVFAIRVENSIDPD